MQIMSQCFAEDAIPPPERVQLLRTLPQSGHEAGDPQISPACQMLLAMRADRVLRRRERGALPALAPFGRDRDELLKGETERKRIGIPYLGDVQ